MHSSIADREMPLLYNAACGVVQPSLYEGFGLPALEAMACAVPVLAARGGALPEVVGDAALLVDPLDEVAMAEGLERLVGDGAERTERVERGLLRARRFDWTQAARQLRALYETA
jgi:glycosyltransferase involved in cell wall biosynthesis